MVIHVTNWNVIDKHRKKIWLSWIMSAEPPYLRIPGASSVDSWLSERLRSSLVAQPQSRRQTGTSCLAWRWWCRDSSGSLEWLRAGQAELCNCSPCCQWTLRRERRRPAGRQQAPTTRVKENNRRSQQKSQRWRELDYTKGSLKYISRRSSIVNHLFLKPSVCCASKSQRQKREMNETIFERQQWLHNDTSHVSKNENIVCSSEMDHFGEI